MSIRPALHVFRNEANEWFVAETAEDAAALHHKMFSADIGEDEYEADADYYAFRQWPDDKPLSIREDGDPPESAEWHTGAEWAAKNGRGFFFAGEP